jgi:hypothetical protein
MRFFFKKSISVLLLTISAMLSACATPSGSVGPSGSDIPVPPGISVERVLKAAAAAGSDMNYTVVGDGGRLVMTKQLPLGSGYFTFNPANQKNRITVTAITVPSGGQPAIRVEGEFLGDRRDEDIRNCLKCDVNKIKNAVRDVR